MLSVSSERKRENSLVWIFKFWKKREKGDLFKRVPSGQGLEPEDIENADCGALPVDHPTEGQKLIDAGHDVVKQPGDEF